MSMYEESYENYETYEEGTEAAYDGGMMSVGNADANKGNCNFSFIQFITIKVCMLF